MSEKSLDFTIPAIKISQRESDGKAIYIAKIKATELGNRTEERFKIDYYKREDGKDSGYQRMLSKNSVEKIKNYLLRESQNPLFPTCILVNSREFLDFSPMEGSTDIGTLSINNTLYVIDGQHRFKAFSELVEDQTLADDLKTYELPMVILSGFDAFEEIEQFFVINSKQKKIKTDLAQRHLLMIKKANNSSNLVSDSKMWELWATKIVDKLNEEIDGVWKGLIILPEDNTDLRKKKMISQNSFVSSLKPLFVGSNAIFKPDQSKGVRVDNWADIISKFWNIVREVYPNAIDNHFDYSLMKTVGAYSMHLILQSYLSKNDNDLDRAFEQIKKALYASKIEEIPESFWKSKVPQVIKDSGKYAGAYSSAVGHKRIKEIIQLAEWK